MKERIMHESRAMGTAFQEDPVFRRVMVTAGVAAAAVLATVALTSGEGFSFDASQDTHHGAANDAYDGRKRIYDSDLASCDSAITADDEPDTRITGNAGFYDGETSDFTTDNPRTWDDFAEAIDQHMAKNGGLAPTDYTVRTVLHYTTAISPAAAHATADQIEMMAVENLHVLPGSPEPPYMPTYVQPADPEMEAQKYNAVEIIIERPPVCPA